MIQRRSFMAAMLAACAAPAIASSGSLMRIFPTVTAKITLWNDGIRDDTAAIQALFDGLPVYSAGGVLLPPRRLIGANVKTSAPIYVGSDCSIEGTSLRATHRGPVVVIKGGTERVTFQNTLFSVQDWDRRSFGCQDEPIPSSAIYKRTPEGVAWRV